MLLVFYAQQVDYSEALGGDIVNVSFQEKPDDDIDYGKSGAPTPPLMKYVLISAYYEESSAKIVEWCDEEEFDRSESIEQIELSRTLMKLTLKNGVRCEVSFRTDDITFHRIKSFLLDDGFPSL